MVKKTFKVNGMTCNSCAHIIEIKLKDKVSKVSASFSKGEVEVEFENEDISKDEIVKLIEDGDEFVVEDKSLDSKKDEKNISDKIGFYFMVGSLLTLLLTLVYFVDMHCCQQS